MNLYAKRLGVCSTFPAHIHSVATSAHDVAQQHTDMKHVVCAPHRTVCGPTESVSGKALPQQKARVTITGSGMACFNKRCSSPAGR